MNDYPNIKDIMAAARRIAPFVHLTPVLTSHTINRLCGADLFFKCENFQKVGAFKARGAVNAVYSLDRGSIVNGVATHSSGNHAAALAYAARCRGIKAYVVMPDNAPPVKKAAVAGYGADIIYSEPNQQAREAALAGVVERTGAAFIHPYNNHLVIAGQATAALELFEQVPALDTIIAPVGGGGLLSGTALTSNTTKPSTIVLGAEPERADDAFRSLQQGSIVPAENPDTIADGLRTSLGDLTFPIIRDYVTAIVTVSEKAVIEAMRLVWERMKIIIEPSAAVPMAAILEKRSSIRGNKIALIISGGNADLDKLPWLKNKG